MKSVRSGTCCCCVLRLTDSTPLLLSFVCCMVIVLGPVHDPAAGANLASLESSLLNNLLSISDLCTGKSMLCNRENRERVFWKCKFWAENARTYYMNINYEGYLYIYIILLFYSEFVHSMLNRYDKIITVYIEREERLSKKLTFGRLISVTVFSFVCFFYLVNIAEVSLFLITKFIGFHIYIYIHIFFL